MNGQRCSQTTAAGEPCQAFAMAGSDRCAAHLRLVSYPNGRLDDEMQGKIVQLVQAGNYIETACVAAGIGRRTFYRWWKRGNPDGEDAEDERFRQFRQAVEEAQSIGEARLVNLIRAEASNDPRLAAWMLERKFPERWARASQRAGGASAETAVSEEEAFNPFAEVDDLAEARARRRG